MSDKSSAVSAGFLLFFGMIFFGSGTPVSKLVGNAFPPVFASGIRMGIAGLVLLPFAYFLVDDLFALTKKGALTVFLVALIGNVAFSLFMLYGMKMISGVIGSVIMSTTPAVTALASVIFLKESINTTKTLAILLSLSGVIVINLSSAGGSSGATIGTLVVGSLLVFGAVCSEATYTLLGKLATEKMPALKLATLSALLSGVLFSPFIFWQGTDVQWQQMNWQNWTALVWWGAGTMALGSALWYSGLKNFPGHIAAGFMAIMPVSALVLSYILLDEKFRWMHLAGFGLTFAGVLLIIWEHMKTMKN